MASRDENWKESELNQKTTTAATNPDAHPDLITGAPGSHPIGSGVGAAGGTVAGLYAGAAIGSVVPGVGTVVGGVVGGIIGGVGAGLAGKGIAEAVNPTHIDEADNAYWRENYKTRPYAQHGRDYEEFEPAYRYGRESRHRYAGRKFDEVESDLRRDWESSNAATGLTWEQARDASRDAWDRADSMAGSMPETSTGTGRDANDQVMGAPSAYGTTAGTGTFGTTAAGSGSAAGASTSFGSPAANASSFGSTAPPAAATPPPLPPLSMAATPATTDAPSSFSDSRGFDDRDFDASYWKQNFTSRAYYTPDSNYADYEPAYRYGAECRTRYAGRKFDEVEPELRSGWEGARFKTRLGWEKAKGAVRDAFEWTERKFAGSGR
jgi:hypothetical protein